MHVNFRKAIVTDLEPRPVANTTNCSARMPPVEPTANQASQAPAGTSLSLVSDAGTEFEALEQLGPMVQSILKSGKQDQFLDQLGVFIKRKESEIERLCAAHFEVRFKFFINSIKLV